MKTYSVCYSPCKDAAKIIKRIPAKDFFEVVDTLKFLSDDSGPVIYFIIEMSVEKKGV